MLFISLEQFFGWLFVTEYLARLWSVGERKEYSGLTGRLKYAATPVALIDLLAVTPFLLAPFIDSMDGTAFYVLRLMRLFRVLTLARTGPFTTAARQIWHGIVDRRYELAFSILVAFAMMIVAATLLLVSGFAAVRFGLIDLITDNTISGRIAKDVFAEMFESGKDAPTIVEEKGLRQVTDTGAIEELIDSVMASQAEKVAEYRSGKDKLFGFFVGQVMKQSQGKANPAMVNELLKKKLAG